MKPLTTILLAALLMLIPVISLAEQEVRPHHPAQCCFREVENCGQYESETVTISTYYPGEDGYNNNFKGQALADQVGWQVAVPTGHEWLGKWIYIDGVGYRKCWDTGCKPGRIDLLVADADAMNAWGLQDRTVWVIGETI